MKLNVNIDDILNNLLTEEINKRCENITDEELFVIRNNNTALLADSNQSGDLELLTSEETKSRDLVQAESIKIKNFEEFIAKQIEKGNISENYKSLHDYYIGIGKTEAEYISLVSDLRNFKQSYATIDVIEKESKVICPDGSESVGSSIEYIIPYKSEKYIFNIKTSKKSCTISINIGDYVGITQGSNYTAENEINSNMQRLNSGDKLTGSGGDLYAYIIDLKNKKILNVESANVYIKYSDKNDKLVDVPNDYIVSKDDILCVNLSKLRNYINKTYPNTRGFDEIKLVNGEIEVTLKKYTQGVISLLG